MAVARVRELDRVRCFSPQPSRRNAFAEQMTQSLGLEVHATTSAQEAVQDAEIVITATDSMRPVVRGEWIGPGTHINAIGANRADARELDAEVIRRCTFIAADSVEQARLEAGDLITPIAGGLLEWDEVRELPSIVCGRVRGRRKAKDVTLFKSLGLAIEDVAVGAFVYERARREGIGTQVSL